MLTAEILAARPSAITLEQTCRIVRRTRNFPPSIHELLQTLQQVDEGREIPGDAADIDWAFGRIDESVTEIRGLLESNPLYQHAKREHAKREAAAMRQSEAARALPQQ